jgi:hypothetical protein
MGTFRVTLTLPLEDLPRLGLQRADAVEGEDHGAEQDELLGAQRYPPEGVQDVGEALSRQLWRAKRMIFD